MRACFIFLLLNLYAELIMLSIRYCPFVSMVKHSISRAQKGKEIGIQFFLFDEEKSMRRTVIYQESIIRDHPGALLTGWLDWHRLIRITMYNERWDFHRCHFTSEVG